MRRAGKDGAQGHTMQAQELEAFVGATIHYFNTTLDSASVGSPYLVEDKAPPVQEFAGAIKISGKRQGVVYFTASRLMLTAMLVRMGEIEMTAENMADLVGEVANTISGNVRRTFGGEFLISTPRVIIGRSEELALPRHVRSVVVPINWRTHSAQLVVCVE